MNGAQLVGIAIIVGWVGLYVLTCSRTFRRFTGELPRDVRARDDLA